MKKQSYYFKKTSLFIFGTCCLSLGMELHAFRPLGSTFGPTRLPRHSQNQNGKSFSQELSKMSGTVQAFSQNANTLSNSINQAVVKRQQLIDAFKSQNQYLRDNSDLLELPPPVAIQANNIDDNLNTLLNDVTQLQNTINDLKTGNARVQAQFESLKEQNDQLRRQIAKNKRKPRYRCPPGLSDGCSNNSSGGNSGGSSSQFTPSNDSSP